MQAARGLTGPGPTATKAKLKHLQRDVQKPTSTQRLAEDDAFDRALSKSIDTVTKPKKKVVLAPGARLFTPSPAFAKLGSGKKPIVLQDAMEMDYDYDGTPAKRGKCSAMPDFPMTEEIENSPILKFMHERIQHLEAANRNSRVNDMFLIEGEDPWLPIRGIVSFLRFEYELRNKSGPVYDAFSQTCLDNVKSPRPEQILAIVFAQRKMGIMINWKKEEGALYKGKKPTPSDPKCIIFSDTGIYKCIMKAARLNKEDLRFVAEQIRNAVRKGRENFRTSHHVDYQDDEFESAPPETYRGYFTPGMERYVFFAVILPNFAVILSGHATDTHLIYM